MKNWITTVNKAIESFFAEPVTKYVIIITSIISLLLIVEAFVDGTNPDGKFLSMGDKQFATNFVEWFGVLYGFLLPTILVRVWEQFDDIDNMLDREADAIEILAGDLKFLDNHFDEFKIKVLNSLEKYSENLIKFVDKELSKDDEVNNGKIILKDIRSSYMEVFQKKAGNDEESDSLKDELLTQLNNIIDCRGDRISLSTQRLYESLNFIAVLTSILWLVPFYFLYFQDQITGDELHLGIFGWLLVIFVTFLIIIILSIIDDLDQPFDGYWMVNIDSWRNLIVYIQAEKTELLSNRETLQSPKQPQPVLTVPVTSSKSGVKSQPNNTGLAKPVKKKPRRKKSDLQNSANPDEPISPVDNAVQ